MSPRLACSRLAEVEDFIASECQCELTDVTAIESALDDASDLLYIMSRGTIFGQCERTVRPCRSCCCGHCLCCCDIDTVPLRSPVISIDEIKIDGLVIDPATYRLLSGARVMRVSDDGVRPPPWPCYQDLWRPDTQEKTFSITYTFGLEEPYPAWVVNALIEVACDVVAAAQHRPTKLPSNTVGIQFQGANVSAARPSSVHRAEPRLSAGGVHVPVDRCGGRRRCLLGRRGVRLALPSGGLTYRLCSPR